MMSDILHCETVYAGCGLHRLHLDTGKNCVKYESVFLSNEMVNIWIDHCFNVKH